jgi:hypothetical protein
MSLVFQDAMHMHCIVICGLHGPSMFSILSHNRVDFGEKVIERKVCFDYLYNFCQKCTYVFM